MRTAAFIIGWAIVIVPPVLVIYKLITDEGFRESVKEAFKISMNT